VKPSRIKRLEEILGEHAEHLFDGLLAKGEGDICNEFGAEFSGLIEKEWLNLSDEASKMLIDNVRPFVQSWRTGDWDAVKKASDAFYVIARDVMADRRKNPRDPESDPASSLLLEKDADGNLLDEFNLV
jgi:cytochrome P450